jgi:hypothetical protein
LNLKNQIDHQFERPRELSAGEISALIDQEIPAIIKIIATDYHIEDQILEALGCLQRLVINVTGSDKILAAIALLTSHLNFPRSFFENILERMRFGKKEIKSCIKRIGHFITLALIDIRPQDMIDVKYSIQNFIEVLKSINYDYRYPTLGTLTEYRFDINDPKSVSIFARMFQDARFSPEFVSTLNQEGFNLDHTALAIHTRVLNEDHDAFLEGIESMKCGSLNLLNQRHKNVLNALILDQNTIHQYRDVISELSLFELPLDIIQVMIRQKLNQKIHVDMKNEIKKRKIEIYPDFVNIDNKIETLMGGITQTSEGNVKLFLSIFKILNSQSKDQLISKENLFNSYLRIVGNTKTRSRIEFECFLCYFGCITKNHLDRILFHLEIEETAAADKRYYSQQDKDELIIRSTGYFLDTSVKKKISNFSVELSNITKEMLIPFGITVKENISENEWEMDEFNYVK